MQPTNGECPHQNVVTHTTGQFFFGNGEIVDTIEDKLICIDCGNEIVEDAQIFELNVFVDLPEWEDVLRCG